MADLLLEKARLLFVQGIDCMTAQDYLGAEQRFSDCLQLFPDRVSVLVNLSAALIKLEKLALAKTHSLRAIECDPRASGAWFNLGIVERLNNQYVVSLDCFNRATAIDPASLDAFLFRGLTELDLSKYDLAVESFRVAFSIAPQRADIYLHSAIALMQLSRHQEALPHLDQAISLEPNFFEAYYQRACLQKDRAFFALAQTDFKKAISIKPDVAEAYYNLAIIDVELKQFDSALSYCRQATTIDPDFAHAYWIMGVALSELGKLSEALVSYQKAIALDVDNAQIYYSQGLAYAKLMRPEAAADSFKKVISIDPQHANAYSDWGLALTDLGQFDLAIEKLHQAIAIDDKNPYFYVNCGFAELASLALDQALHSFNCAIEIQADCVEAYYGKATTLLMRGDYLEGWSLYEWRSKYSQAQKHKRDFLKTQWLGDADIAGKTILLYCEQGFGDTIQFCRFVPLVVARGAKVILEVPKPLMNLLSELAADCQLVVQGAVLPPYDFHCGLLSLPHAFKTQLHTIPLPEGYLHPDPKKVSFWRDRLGVNTPLRVGLVWNGGHRPDQPELWPTNQRRNIPLSLLLPLKHQGVVFFSLQKGRQAELELSELKRMHWDGPDVMDYTQDLNDFSDTAAFISQLDLVISVDTATAHVAAALGKPVWLLNRYDTCWRWLVGTDHSPWYCSVRLFRQRTPGDWPGVIAEVKQALVERVTSSI